MSFPLMPFAVQSKNPVKVSFIKSVSTGSDQTTYQILGSGIDLGAPDPTRELIVLPCWTYQSGAKTLASCNVGSPASITGTVFSQQINFDGNGFAAAAIPIPTGSTPSDNIYVTFSAGIVFFGAYLFRVTGRRVPGSDAGGVSSTGTATSSSVSLTVPWNSVVIGATNTAATNTVTYQDSGVGMTTVDTITQDNGDTTNAGYGTTQTRGSSATITSSWSASRNWSAIAFALS
jgi:hypothetical protein